LLLIYSPISSSRLEYICTTLFNKEVSITTDKSVYLNETSAKVNYSDEDLSDHEFKIAPAGLLFQQHIQEQQLICFEWNGLTRFYKTDSGTLPYDLFSAAFYLISRYEEWLPFLPDQYGRFAHINSLAHKNNFLHLPLVQLWLLEFEKKIQEYYPKYQLPKSEFSFVPTYDVDIAFCYLHQPFFKNLFGFYRDLLTGKLESFVERGNVYSGFHKDPYDQFEFLDEINSKYKLPAIYFFLLAEKRKGVDKNIHPSKKTLQELIKKTAIKYPTGIHPSWQSGENFEVLEKEIGTLSTLIQHSVSISRQHYLKMTIPDTYPLLLKAGIKKDYTMGYGTSNGFRASFAKPFFWYDLRNEQTTELEIHPFCYMDANSIFELRLPVYDAKNELQELYKQIKKVHGEMVCIFHNHFLTDQPAWTEWKKMYTDFLAENFPISLF
jgi:hypothetical protein